MLDLTENEEERKYFIVHVDLLEGLKEYEVEYADGHIERFPFSVHNFNVDLYRMKEQYYKYSDDVKDEIIEWSSDILKNQLKCLLLTVLTIIFETNTPLPGLWKVVVIILTILVALGYEIRKYIDLMYAGYGLGYLNDMDVFMENMEGKNRINFKNPLNNQDEYWYLFNPSMMDLGVDVDIYNQTIENLSPEEKDESAKRLVKILKENKESD